ncbi:MAG TPA: hypothetical protein VIJ14_10635, partial [Rhabdochlamydiaceae bacterium]
MVTKSGELRTYYQRNWETVFPKFSKETWNNISHVAGLALPFLGLLYKPAGTAISLGSTYLNFFSSGCELRNAKNEMQAPNVEASEELRKKAKSRFNQHAWSVLKNGVEFVGTIASLRIGLVVHSVMHIGEHSYTLATKFNKSTWSKTGERMLPIASNALYLLTLVSFSTPVAYGVIVASLVFQAGCSLYKARSAYKEANTMKDIKILDAVAHGAMAVIFAAKAETAIQQCYKIYTAVPRTFVLMRPASKNNKETNSISEKGIKLAEGQIPVALRKIAQEKGKKTLFFYTSFAGHHVDTAIIVANKYDDNEVWVSRRQELNEAKKPKISMKDQVGGYIPPHVKTRTLPLNERWEILEKRWVESGIESPAQNAARVDGAIRQILDQHPEGPSLPVIVTGGTNMT